MRLLPLFLQHLLNGSYNSQMYKHQLVQDTFTVSPCSSLPPCNPSLSIRTFEIITVAPVYISCCFHELPCINPLDLYHFQSINLQFSFFIFLFSSLMLCFHRLYMSIILFISITKIKQISSFLFKSNCNPEQFLPFYIYNSIFVHSNHTQEPSRSG